MRPEGAEDKPQLIPVVQKWEEYLGKKVVGVYYLPSEKELKVEWIEADD